MKGDNYYDVAIVGAGPSGSTCAFYLSKAGKKVLLLDKKQFPRDKYCGDAVSYLAQHYLREMGAFQELVAEKKLRMVIYFDFNFNRKQTTDRPQKSSCVVSLLTHSIEWSSLRKYVW
mgnify:CR=1 FL=1